MNVVLRSAIEWFDKQTGSFNWSGNPLTGAAYVEIVGGTPGGGSSPSDLSTGTKQDVQTALLTTIANASLPDKETPYITFKCNTAFTGASVDDIIAGILTINTVTNSLVSSVPIWYNFSTGAVMAVADVTKLTTIASNSLTAAQLSLMTLATTQALVPVGAGITSKTASVSSQTLLAANVARTGVIIHNNSIGSLWLKYGATATSSIGGYTYLLYAGDTLEVIPIQNGMYTGVISGIWASANGGCSITELS